MLMNTICYKQKVPTVYNRGTKYESSCDHFLYVYASADKVQAQKRVDELNAKLAQGISKYDDLDMTNIEYFYLDRQEAFTD